MNNNNKYITISAINKYLKYLMDENPHLNKVYLKGEISNFKAHTRGHYYFTLKDETSRINAVMFSYHTSGLKITPADGMKVLVTGKITVYEPTGGYQIYVEEMEEDGIGDLYVAFEKLKAKLEKEGLFSQSHKKEIPKIPQRIGIITASTGAAIRDILTTIKRRYPLCETILFPALVQGKEAALDIANKIKIANTYDLDTLIVGRGGGSIEDLWPFNEEIVAREIYNSKIPVISAVGHEIDFTIADFVADMRAPTPTAAAELAVPELTILLKNIKTLFRRATNATNKIITYQKVQLSKYQNSYILKKPMSMYEIKEQKLDNLIDNLNKNIKNKLEKYNITLFKLQNSYILTNPQILYKFKTQTFQNLISKLQVLNPMNTINRGYALVKKDKKVISTIKKLKKDDTISIVLKDGVVTSKVFQIDTQNIEGEDSNGKRTII